ncbi:MAG: hypothetical protein AAF399_07700, partial [Bacteroidota bacterium]
MKRVLFRIALILVAVVLLLMAWMGYNLRDRFDGYEVDVDIAAKEAGAFQMGFAKQSITPEVPDRWEDINGNAKYEPEKGDTFEDLNGNGEFDAVWLAGFNQKRAANGVHDSLWARAMVIDDGQTAMALVAIDAIGFGHDDVVRVRKRISETAGLDYVTVISTHVHESPDLVGMWGESPYRSGIDPEYMELVISQTARAVEQARSAQRPAYLRIGENLEGTLPMLADTRKPEVYDPALHLIQALDAEADTTLGTLICWANHPETLWSRNLMITSDFPHFVREGVEKGVFDGDSLVVPGLGGTSVYVNGSIGGLMTTDPRTSIEDPFADTSYLAPSFDKARAQGQQLALLGLASLAQADTIQAASLSLRAKTLDIPLVNPLFRLGAALGVLQRGMSRWMHMRSEIAYWEFGSISCLQVPGEIYPEIINGGVEAPEGQDYALSPLEIPPLRPLMPGKHPLVIGLANDLIGYIVPKSQWDQEAPHTYGKENAPYGEINSLGPETAPLL